MRGEDLGHGLVGRVVAEAELRHKGQVRKPKLRIRYGWAHYTHELLRAIGVIRPVLRKRGLRLEISSDPRTKELLIFIEVSQDRAKLVAVKMSEREWWLTPSIQERYWARFMRHLSRKLARMRGQAFIDSEMLILTGRFGKRHLGREGHKVHLRRSPSGATRSIIKFSYYQPPRALAGLIAKLLKRIAERQLERIMASCQAKGVSRPYGRLGDLCAVLSDLRDHLRAHLELLLAPS